MLNKIFKETPLDVVCDVERIYFNRKKKEIHIEILADTDVDNGVLEEYAARLKETYGLKAAKVSVAQSSERKGQGAEVEGEAATQQDDAADRAEEAEGGIAQEADKRGEASLQDNAASYEEYKKSRERKATVKERVSPQDETIYGGDISGGIAAMSEITADSGIVRIEGEVFSVTQKEIWGGKTLFAFEVYDGQGSMACKLIIDSSEAGRIADKLVCKARVSIKGEAQYDKYSREVVVLAQAIKRLPNEAARGDDAKVKRVELHLHTQMSAMDAVAAAKELVARAVAWGHDAVAITDHGVVQAFPEAYDVIKRNDNFKVIYGVECYLTEDRRDEESFKKQSVHHAVILAKNYVGLKNLYKIVSNSHISAFYKRPRVQKSVLEAHREGLILGSACERGEVFEAVLEGRPWDEVEKIAAGYDYLEIMPLGNNQFMIDKGIVKGAEDLREINKKIVKLGERLGKPVVATGDVHFLDPQDAIYRAILQAGQGYDDADKQAPLYFRTTDEMLEEFSYLGEQTAYKVVVENTRTVADMVERLQPIPDGTFPPVMEGAESEVRKMCEDRAIDLYGAPLPEEVSSRMERELDKITKYGFSVMYLISQKLVSKSLSDGYLVGSRGSVGSSFVAFLCGITEVNALMPHYYCVNCKYHEFIIDGSVGCGVDLPHKNCPQCGQALNKDGHDIPFETFLGFEGDKEPDIDLNFSGDYQAIAHKYTEELFGEENVFRAGTISTLASRTAYGFVKKYLESRGREVHGAEVNRLVKGCIGVKRTTGQHPGGIMILPKGRDIHEFCPVQHPADDKSKDIITTHFDYHSISGRLLKLDILGHDDPTMIRMLEDLTGIDARAIPLDDPQTMSIFTSTEALGVRPKQIGSPVGTYGVPEFGTRFVRQMLVDTAPSTFTELVRISGLSHGTDVWLGNAQDLVKEGTATLKEIICTRDDIMVYLMYKGLPSKAAFDIMERVRKGKKLTSDDEIIMRKNKVPEWYINSCNKIQYMFPKAHAVAYVTMAYRIAYFKVHFPEAFYITYLSVRAEEFDASLMCDKPKVQQEIQRLEADESKLNQKDKNVLTILQIVREMFARGMKLLPVDIYKSDASKFKKEEDGIRPPLIALAGLGKSAALAIEEARAECEFSSVEDLKNRGKVNKTVLELFKKHGCLGDLPESNQLSFF